MHKKPVKHSITKQILTSAFMVLAVLAIVSMVTLLMLGYRLNTNDGNIEQYAILQFNSSPSGATITVDGSEIGRTPDKSVLPAGQHEVSVWKKGYKTWRKTVNSESGVLDWLNYILLVPDDIQMDTIKEFESVYDSLASPDGDYILVQTESDEPTFSLVSLAGLSITSNQIDLPDAMYSQSEKHSFTIHSWDQSGRYVLLQHRYDDNLEWIVMDTRSVDKSKNLTSTFTINITDALFIGNNANEVLVLNSGNLRVLDLSSETISKVLVSQVSDFSYYPETDVVTYVRKVESSDKSVSEIEAGVYLDSVGSPVTIRVADSKSKLLIETARYFNEDYIVIIEDKNVDIISGGYPSNSDDSNNLKVVASFDIDAEADSLSFSPSGEFVFIRSGEVFYSFDLEYQELYSSIIAGSTANTTVEWLNDNYILSIKDGDLSIREFDGQNANVINYDALDQAVILSSNSRYIYCFSQTNSGYELSRLNMIL